MEGCSNYVTGPIPHVSDLVYLGMGHPICTFTSFHIMLLLSGMGSIFCESLSEEHDQAERGKYVESCSLPWGWDGKEYRRGFWMGNTCTQGLIHVDVWQTTTILK